MVEHHISFNSLFSMSLRIVKYVIQHIEISLNHQIFGNDLKKVLKLFQMQILHFIIRFYLLFTNHIEYCWNLPNIFNIKGLITRNFYYCFLEVYGIRKINQWSRTQTCKEGKLVLMWSNENIKLKGCRAYMCLSSQNWDIKKYVSDLSM